MAEATIDYSGPICSLVEAKQSGSKRYFTGKPCNHGHIAQRLVSCRSCCSCALVRVTGLQKNRSPVYLRRVANEIKSRARKNEKKAGRRRSSSCELCGVETDTVFDHCHTNGHFRGWLCSQCNMALGLVKDSSSLLRKMARYLDRSNGSAKQHKISAIWLKQPKQTGIIRVTDRFSPALMLAKYRESANDFMRKQVGEFKQLSPADQREFLFFMMANMAISQAAIVDSIEVVDRPASAPENLQ